MKKNHLIIGLLCLALAYFILKDRIKVTFSKASSNAPTTVPVISTEEQALGVEKTISDIVSTVSSYCGACSSSVSHFGGDTTYNSLAVDNVSDKALRDSVRRNELVLSVLALEDESKKNRALLLLEALDTYERAFLGNKPVLTDSDKVRVLSNEIASAIKQARLSGTPLEGAEISSLARSIAERKSKDERFLEDDLKEFHSPAEVVAKSEETIASTGVETKDEKLARQKQIDIDITSDILEKIAQYKSDIKSVKNPSRKATIIHSEFVNSIEVLLPHLSEGYRKEFYLSQGLESLGVNLKVRQTLSVSSHEITPIG